MVAALILRGEDIALFDDGSYCHSSHRRSSNGSTATPTASWSRPPVRPRAARRVITACQRPSALPIRAASVRRTLSCWL